MASNHPILGKAARALDTMVCRVALPEYQRHERTRTLLQALRVDAIDGAKRSLQPAAVAMANLHALATSSASDALREAQQDARTYTPGG